MAKLFKDIESLRVVLKRNEKLGGLCADVGEILRLTKKGTVAIREIETKVARNPELAARALKMANSPAYGAKGARTLGQAIAMLGLPGLRSILLSVAVRSGMGKTTLPGFDSKVYLRRSLAAGLLFTQFARRLKLEEPERFYIAGLLQDVGYLVISHFSPKSFSSLRKAVELAPGASQVQIERAIWGFCHAEIGGTLAEEWGFDPMVAACIRYHHEPLAAPKELMDICDIANVTGWICDEMKLNHLPGISPPPADAMTLQRLQISDEELGDLCSDLLEHAQDADAALDEAA